MAGREQPLSPRTAGVVGWPIAHTLSPLIHQTFAAREGVDAVYIPIAAEPGFEAFSRAMKALESAGFRGVNVTIPHKENALRYAASASDEAKRAGAANMLSFGPEGCYAENSDIAGFSSALDEVPPPDEARARAVILGAGGAARGVVIALQDRGFADIVIANRTGEKAGALAREFGLKSAPWEDRSKILAGARLIVNTTSLGMAGEPPLQISLDALPRNAIVADIVYKPLETRLLAVARARGHATVDGLSMLMHQAVPAYKRWLGSVAEVDADLRARLEAALAARNRQETA